ncbi:hypothetical protein [Clostridium sp.]|uniref:hypothetical protein n=1 Tax=Clostridium sp. TaxID=1506 RepID=UPI0035A00298
MISKSTKIFLIATFVYLIVMGSFFLYIFNRISYLEDRSGKYYYKMHILNKNNNESFKWDIGISDNDIKQGVIENGVNKGGLEKFAKII